MSSRRASLILVLLSACLPDNPSVATDTDATGEPTSTGTQPTTGGETSGLFACDSPPCKLVLISQSLDDRIDVYDVTNTPTLRGRINLDLKPDPSGQQISGNLLDEPYELALTSTDLIVTIGHYPDTDQGSLIRFPLADFADVPAQLLEPPRLWKVSSECTTGKPSQAVSPGLEQVHLLRQPVLLRPGAGDKARWLVASGPTDAGVVIVKGGASPTLCGKLGGLDLLAADNAPWALALDATGEHLAIGAGPPSNPELAEGKGQVLWATLDVSKLVDLNEGRFQASAPETWVRAPNVVMIAEIGGGS